MIALLNFLIAILITTFYSLANITVLNFWGVLHILLVFIISFVLAMIALLLVLAFYVFIVQKTNPRSKFKHFFLQLYTRYIFNFILRVKLIYTGKENLPVDDNFVVYSNHIHATDPLYIYEVYRGHRMAFVAKKSLYKIPLVKQIMKSIGCTSIDQFQDRSALITILDTIKLVKAGQPFGIFPEGTRGYSNDIKEFRPGSFKIALKAKTDISPVVLYNMMDIFEKKRFFKRVKVYLHVLPVIKYEDIKGMDSIELSDKVRKSMVEQTENFKQTITRG